MRPYGRIENIKGGREWKRDYHPRKGWVNWWEDMKSKRSRSYMKQLWKKEIKRDEN